MNKNSKPDEHFLKRIGSKIASARHSRVEKSTTVAKAIGVTQSIISQIENGKYYSLKLTTIIALCQYLEIPLSEILN